MASLYKLTEDYKHVEDMLFDESYDEQTIKDTLDAIGDAIEEKADSYAMLMKNLDSDIEALEREEQRLRYRRKALENRKEWLKGNLFEAMKATGKTKFKTTLFSFGIQKNGGKRALILNVEPTELPACFQKVTITADNEALREAMGTKESCEWCYLEEQGESLRIR